MSDEVFDNLKGQSTELLELERANIDLALSLKDVYARYKKVYATAESLTAGMIASVITEIPGSSAWFDRGFVTYSNEAKAELLGVDMQTIAAYGAVSEPTVLQMAAGAVKRSNADIAVAVSGIAGPDGGSASKPVGTEWFGLMKRGERPFAFVKTFPGNRACVRALTVREALRGLIDLSSQD